MTNRPNLRSEEFAAARLALVSSGQRSLGGPRRAIEDPAEDEEQLEPSKEQPGRWTSLRLGRAQFLALALFLLAVVGIVVVGFLKASAKPIPVEPEPAVVFQPSSTPSPAASSPTMPVLRVHVIGAVAQPGVVELTQGAIVADAIAAAGGMTDHAVAGELNLATGLTDGMQIRVGSEDQPSQLDSSSAQRGSVAGENPMKINLNQATEQDLQLLPGVGPATAEAILTFRKEHGGFTSVKELREVSGIGDKTFAKLEPLVSV